MNEAPDLFRQIAACQQKHTPDHPLSHPEEPRRPVIGLPATQLRAQRGRWLLEAADAAVVRALLDAGADPLLFPCRPLAPPEDLFAVVWQQLRRCDGLLLPGGVLDCYPGWYQETPQPLSQGATSAWWWEDWWKFHLAQVATLIGLPLLGICQGLHYWVVANGGRLYQDIRSQYRQAARHCRGTGDTQWQLNAIRVRENQDSILSQCAEHARAIWGACMHHQAVREAPAGLVVTALELDGLIASVERVDGFFGIGVQWHPEQREIYATQPYSRRLFTRFVAEARSAAYSQRPDIDAFSTPARTYLGTPLQATEGVARPSLPLLSPQETLSRLDTRPERVLSARAARAWLREDPASQVLFA